ncbi:MAG: hypothetical protein ACW99F_15985 [Candidatus Hodarchaeales archaeon]|jgi:hypothetical protein
MSALWVLIILASTDVGTTFSQSIGPYMNSSQCEAAANIVKEQLGEVHDRVREVDTLCIPIVVKQQ